MNCCFLLLLRQTINAGDNSLFFYVTRCLQDEIEFKVAGGGPLCLLGFQLSQYTQGITKEILLTKLPYNIKQNAQYIQRTITLKLSSLFEQMKNFTTKYRLKFLSIFTMTYTCIRAENTMHNSLQRSKKGGS